MARWPAEPGMLRRMKAVITGASGLLGGNIAALLVERGHSAACTRRASTRVAHLAHLPLEWRDAELGSVAGLAEAFRGAEVVFHCAAQVSVRRALTPELRSANVDGTRHVIDACRKAGVQRLVHVSSSVAVAVSEDGRDVTEDAVWNLDRFGLDDGYARSKVMAEALVREAVASGLDAVIINPTYMLGPMDARPSSGKMIIDVVRGRVPGGTPGVNCFVDVRAVARGALAAAERGRAGERYILGGENMSYMDAFKRMAVIAGVKPPRFVLPRLAALPFGLLGDMAERLLSREALVTSTSLRWAYCKAFRLSSAKAVRELGYDPGSFDDAVRDAIAWFRQAGMLN